jgi:hypothetical protein
MTMKRFAKFALFFLCASALAVAENCLTTGDMDPAQRAAIENAAKQYYGYTAAGDVASLRTNAIHSLASNFGGIENSVTTNKDAFAGTQPNVYSSYLLDATGGPATIDSAMFLCGVYNSPDRIQFSIQNLPAAKYALVIMDASGPKGPYWLSLILQEMNGGWKLAGFYPKARRVGDKGPGAFLTQARDFRAKGELHNAYFYYVAARELALPVSFMMTRPVEKLDSEAQPIVPKDVPGDQPVTLTSATGKTYQIIDISPLAIGNGMDLRVRYKAVVPVSDTRASYDSNMDVMKTFAAKYPEYKSAFAGYVVRAVDPQTGQDYGTVLGMDQIK